MISSGPKTLTVVEKKMTVKNHKVGGEPLGHVKEFLKSIWLWPIKIFYSIFFLTRFQSIWKTRTLKTLHGKLSSQASFRCLPRTIKPLLSADCSRWQVLLRHSVWPRGLCRVTNKGSGRKELRCLHYSGNDPVFIFQILCTFRFLTLENFDRLFHMESFSSLP